MACGSAGLLAAVVAGAACGQPTPGENATAFAAAAALTNRSYHYDAVSGGQPQVATTARVPLPVATLTTIAWNPADSDFYQLKTIDSVAVPCTLVATFTAPYATWTAPAGTVTTLQFTVGGTTNFIMPWVTWGNDLRQYVRSTYFSDATVPTPTDVQRRIQQAVGLPTTTGTTAGLAMFWAPIANLARPAYSADVSIQLPPLATNADGSDRVTEAGAPPGFSYLDTDSSTLTYPTLTEFVEWNQAQTTYPWSAMGYTYNWNALQAGSDPAWGYGPRAAASVVGVSEFIVSAGSKIVNERFVSHADLGIWAVPEPSVWMLVGVGWACGGVVLRRRRAERGGTANAAARGTVVVLAAAATVLAVASAPAADDLPVRVMSFNVRYGTAGDGDDAWPGRRDAVIGAIREFDPDLLGLQEVLAFQRDELAAALPGYEAVAAGRDDGHEAGEMTPVLFRAARFERCDAGHFWLSATPAAAGSRGWDAALPRIATWVRLRDRSDPEGREVLVLNTHFDHRGTEARRQAARLVRERLAESAGECRVVLTGDFNAAEGSEPYRDLFSAEAATGLGLVDTLRAVEPQPGAAEGTFSGFDPAATTGPRIDWIGCSADWEVRLAGIDRTIHAGRTPSDHWPVTAVLRAARPERPPTIRVLSYNIHHGRGTDGTIDMPRLARVIRRADPDLVALQEVDERTTRSGGIDEAAELSRLTGLRMVFGPQIDYLGGRYGQALLARCPLGPPTVHELPGIGGDRERRIAIAADVDHPGGPLTFVGTHLHHRSDEARSAQARALVGAFAATDRCILAGDINALPGSEPLAILDAAWRRVAADAGSPPTFPAGIPTRAIDHVFFRPAEAFNVLDLRVLDEPVASDHRPILAILARLPAPGASQP